MSGSLLGLIGIAVMLVLLALRTPVGMAMIVVGFVGNALLIGFDPALSMLATETFSITSSYALTIIPLFVLMGNLASASGLSRSLYDAAYAWIGSWRGGLASATIVGCGGFAAVCGSSVASAITMGRVALPEMERRGYDARLATGTVAAGGTLGILIPPSTGFVIYAILTEQSIGKLFIAGILPGLLLIALFIIAITLVVTFRPGLAPSAPRLPLKDRLPPTLSALPMVGVIVVSIGGIYAGVFTPTEAAGIGAFLVFLVAVARREMSLGTLRRVLVETVRTSAMTYLILIGAHIFAPFLALTHLPSILAAGLLDLGLGAYGTLSVVLFVYIILGMFLEGFAMLVLTLPIIFPLMMKLGFDPIWFGVMIVILLEMSLVTPPVGLNVFVVKSIAPKVPMGQIFVGILPFWAALFVCMVALVLFPSIATFLPSKMF